MENNQNQGAAGEQQNTPTAANPQENQPAFNVEALAEALTARQQRAERSVINSFAQQYSMSAEELTQLLNERRAQQAAAIPEEVQTQINQRMQTADNRLIAAEVKAIGTRMNLVDTDAAFALMDKSGIAVDEAGNVTGVQEALDALIQEKQWLVAQPTPSGTGSAGNFPRGNNMESTDYAARLAEARKSGNHTLATAIISEAAAKGIALR